MQRRAALMQCGAQKCNAATVKCNAGVPTTSCISPLISRPALAKSLISLRWTVQEVTILCTVPGNGVRIAQRYNFAEHLVDRFCIFIHALRRVFPMAYEADGVRRRLYSKICSRAAGERSASSLSTELSASVSRVSPKHFRIAAEFFQ